MLDKEAHLQCSLKLKPRRRPGRRFHAEGGAAELGRAPRRSGARAPDRTGIGRPASFPALQLIAREVFGGGGKKFFLIKKKKKRKEIKTHTWNIYSSTLLSSQPYYKRYGL